MNIESNHQANFIKFSFNKTIRESWMVLLLSSFAEPGTIPRYLC